MLSAPLQDKVSCDGGAAGLASSAVGEEVPWRLSSRETKGGGGRLCGREKFSLGRKSRDVAAAQR